LKRNPTKNTEMRLLLIRNSAMGDVALTAPVLKALREQYPDIEVILLTRPVYWAFFTSFKGIQLFFADFEKRHKGLKGSYVLFRDLQKQGEIDYVIDLHDVLRSKILRILFSLVGVPSVKIDKGRRQKKMVIAGKSGGKLRHSVERYMDVLEKAGLKITAAGGPWIIPSRDAIESSFEVTGINGGINIGVAPYARHDLKIWPEEYMVALLNRMSERYNASFWLFGGKEEHDRLESLASRVRRATNLSGKLQLGEEIAVISKLDLMISMDSSNMHVAALAGTKVISIWGATDPVIGFGAWNQPEEYSVSIPRSDLPCRPCTVFGKGKCRRKDHACMIWLEPEMVYQKIESLGIF
jgi:ADP-heptose:LPS heptosyltransferase